MNFIRYALDTPPRRIARKVNTAIAAKLKPGSALTEKQRTTLQFLRTANQSAPSPFRATRHWQQVTALFDRDFKLHGLAEIEDAYYNLRFSGFAKGDQRLAGYLIWTYYQILRKRDKLDLLAHLEDDPKHQVVSHNIQGKVYSLDTLLSINDFYNILELLPDAALDKPLIVADIGAGWGRLGRVVKTAAPAWIYVVFDLPEPLLISSCYLPKVISYASVKTSQDQDVHDAKTIDRAMLSRAGLWFLGSQDLGRVADGGIDVVVNVASFQEMMRQQVAEYLSVIDRKAHGGRFYAKELWDGSIHGHHSGEIAGFDQYEFPTTWERQFLRTSAFSTDLFEVGFAVK